MFHWLRTPCAVLMNVYVGLWVVCGELYWLFGPARQQQRNQTLRERRISAGFLRLQAQEDPSLRAELAAESAELIRDGIGFAERRASFLVRLRRRSGIEHLTFEMR